MEKPNNLCARQVALEGAMPGVTDPLEETFLLSFPHWAALTSQVASRTRGEVLVTTPTFQAGLWRNKGR